MPVLLHIKTADTVADGSKSHNLYAFVFQRIFLRLFQGVNRNVNVQRRPVQIATNIGFHICYIFDISIPKCRVILI